MSDLLTAEPAVSLSVAAGTGLLGFWVGFRDERGVWRWYRS